MVFLFGQNVDCLVLKATIDLFPMLVESLFMLTLATLLLHLPHFDLKADTISTLVLLAQTNLAAFIAVLIVLVSFALKDLFRGKRIEGKTM